MKILLGDNQFFGINHNDLNKAKEVKKKFPNVNSIHDFICSSMDIGLDGFMINSNSLGYKLIKKYEFDKLKEIHYSIPYPHKYASIVNEKGMLNLMYFFIKNTSIFKLLKCLPFYLFTRNLKYLIPIATSLEVPKSLPKGSTIYLQNILTDLILGIERVDMLEEFALDVRSQGYKLGLITLNPIVLNSHIINSEILNKEDLTVCFNINYNGFNVFPDKFSVENFVKSDNNYKLMGMSILSSGGSNIKDSIDYIKNFNLDYIVFGSSNLKNIENNYNSFKKNIE